ncbi:hypothetical protein B9G55_07040 [Saccharibacillus sp. O16]|nr:hypothetical protein B9G55_07040 [Saccharibacillus sp. O16]
MLASLLVLGGCLRFGPQADEMEQTASQSANSTPTDESATSDRSANPEESAALEAAPESAQEASTDEEDENGAEQSSTSETGDAAASGDQDAKDTKSTKDTKNTEENQSIKDDASKEKTEIEAAVSRDDTESLLTINLQQLPQGYSLLAMTWTPTASVLSNPADSSSSTELPLNPNSASSDESTSSVDSKSVTTSYHDAILAGQAGAKGFFIDQNGQRIGYRYTEQQKGRSGMLRLDFRDRDGGTVSWEEQVTLGAAEAAISGTP